MNEELYNKLVVEKIRSLEEETLDLRNKNQLLLGLVGYFTEDPEISINVDDLDSAVTVTFDGEKVTVKQ